MKRFFVCALLLVSISKYSSAQITFQKTYYGQILRSGGYCIQQTSDKGYIVGGYNLGFNTTNEDMYLIKIDSVGNKLWTHFFGGTGDDGISSVEQTSDGGYIIGGYTGSFAASYDAYIIKTDSVGNKLWSKTYGGLQSEGGIIQKTNEGGYIIAGNTDSFGSGLDDIYLIKTNALGDTLWTKVYGGTNNDFAHSHMQTMDGGYIICGSTFSFGANGEYVYLIKTDSIGNLLWTKVIGETNQQYDGRSIQQTLDGGYIITGTVEQVAGIVTSDVSLIKTDSVGNPLWTKAIGGINNEWANSVQQTIDGGYIITGWTETELNDYLDMYLIKTDANGDTLWTKTYGGADYDWGASVKQTDDGGYIVVGSTKSFGTGNDIYIIKTDANGYSPCNLRSTPTHVNSLISIAFSPATIGSSTNIIVASPATTADSGGVVFSLCTSVGITPLSKGERLGVRISPNPSTGTFTISFNHNITKGTVQILNLLGETLEQQSINNETKKEIYLKSTPSGIYFVKVQNGENQYSAKIIVE